MKIAFKFIALHLTMLTLVISNSWASDDILKLRDLSLEELMKVEVSVASKTKDKTLRETPGIVSIITDEEIAQRGARDLIDVLQFIQGFYFGVDLINVVGIGMRGSWVHEGKILMLIDGIEMNERNYSNLALGNHYPLEHIKRIEIMRGPGSVNYGGFAELGVINIITKNANDIDGFQINFTRGQMQKAVARQTASFMYGKKINKDIEITAAGYAGRGMRSDEEYVDPLENRTEMKDSSHLNPHFVNIGIRYGNFSSRFLSDNYRLQGKDGYGEILEQPWKADFQMWAYQAKYFYDFNDDMKLSVEGGYQHDTSWGTDNGTPEDFIKNLVEHSWLKSHLNYNFNDKLRFATGFEFSLDKSTDKKVIDPQKIPIFRNYTAFLESDYKSTWGNITTGIRYDHHNLFGSAVVPRLALTNIIDKFHYKLLYGNSFRTPVAYNVYLMPEIQTEKSKVLEAEIGYQIHKNMNVTFNVFDNMIRNMIVYEVSPITGTDGYFNSNEKMGARGAELEWRFKEKWGDIVLNYSFYRKAYGSPQNQKVLNHQTGEEYKSFSLAFPIHKATLNATFNLTPQLTLNSSLIFYSSRYGYEGKDENGNSYLKKFSASTLANVFLRYQPTWFKNSEIGIGIYDIFNDKFRFIQPYNGGHNPLPAPTREIVLKIGYKF
jgi:outer membrane cobalamin receptor